MKAKLRKKGAYGSIYSSRKRWGQGLSEDDKRRLWYDKVNELRRQIQPRKLTLADIGGM